MKTELIYTEKLNGGKIWKLFIKGNSTDPNMTHLCRNLFSSY